MDTDVGDVFGQGILVRVSYEGRNVYFYIGWVPIVDDKFSGSAGKEVLQVSLVNYLKKFGMDLAAIGGKLGVVPVYPFSRGPKVWYNPPMYQGDATITSMVPWYAVAYTYGQVISDDLIRHYTEG